jgi:hypothetical protein
MFGAALVALVTIAASVEAHHSFAMYNVRITTVMTGVVTRVDPAPNHLQIFFAQMNPERTNVERGADDEPIVWSVEMGGSAQMARQGISVNSFPPGTVFSVGLHPLRNGEPAGSREGGLFKCPGRTPPEPGMHCDSVPGYTAIGNGPLPTPTEP